MEAENLGGNDSVPLLVTRLQSSKGAEHNTDVPPALCHVPLSLGLADTVEVLRFFVVFELSLAFQSLLFNILLSFVPPSPCKV